MTFGIAHPHSRLITKAIKSERATERQKERDNKRVHCFKSETGKIVNCGKSWQRDGGGREVGREGKPVCPVSACPESGCQTTEVAA